MYIGLHARYPLFIHSMLSKVLQPLLGPGHPQKTPPFFSVFCDVSLLTMPSYLFLVFPLVLYYEISHYELFCDPLIFHSYNVTHSSLIILIQSTIFSSLYKLYISLFHLGYQGPVTCIPIIIVRF